MFCYSGDVELDNIPLDFVSLTSVCRLLGTLAYGPAECRLLLLATLAMDAFENRTNRSFSAFAAVVDKIAIEEMSGYVKLVILSNCQIDKIIGFRLGIGKRENRSK